MIWDSLPNFINACFDDAQPIVNLEMIEQPSSLIVVEKTNSQELRVSILQETTTQLLWEYRRNKVPLNVLNIPKHFVSKDIWIDEWVGTASHY